MAQQASHPAVSVDGWGDLPDDPILVADFPAEFRRLGIGMFVSPQELARQGKPIILDLKERELRESSGPDDIQATTHGLMRLVEGPARLCSDDDGSIHGRSFVVTTSLNGTPTDLMLDTGSPLTEVFEQSAVGKDLVAKAPPMQLERQRTTHQIVAEATLLVGTRPKTVTVDVIPARASSFCPRDGDLAMDVLAACVLVLEAEDARVYCP